MQPRAARYKVGGLNFIYDTGESYWAAPVVDLSESGLFLETSHQLPVATHVTLLADVPDSERLPFELKGEVVRVTDVDNEGNFNRPPGLGFRLVDLRPDQYNDLKQFLERRGVPVRSK
ncbi:MAG: PilZ domain-containing protein [Clostridia bacterium]|nr:PilZ domain-containing protein [Deltaproteobacteria bacterium]